MSHHHQDVHGNTELKAKLLNETGSKFGTEPYKYYADVVFERDGAEHVEVAREFEWGPFRMQPQMMVE